jgi:signal transduction histidine kinase
MKQSSARGKPLESLVERQGVSILALVSVTLLPLIFAFDVSQPEDIVFSVLYVAPIVLTLMVGLPRTTYLVFVVTSVATVAAAVLGSSPTQPTAEVVNRALALIAQTLAAAVVIQQLQLRERDDETAHIKDEHFTRAGPALVETALGAARATILALPDAAFILDAAGTIVDANTAAATLLSMPITAFKGERWDDVSEAFTLSLPTTTLERGDLFVAGWPSNGPATIAGEFVVGQRMDVERFHCRVSAVTIFERGQVAGGVVIATDISNIHAREQLKDEFVSMATHELRTPISTLRGYAQLAELGATRAGEQDVAASAAKIVRQADRLTRLVEDLLDVSRIQTGRMQLSIGEMPIVKAACDAIEQQRAAHPDREIHFERVGSLESVQADAHRIEQVLTNLLDNALKYSPDGGPVHVRVVGAPTEVSFTVTDCGVGIPLDEQGQLFQQYYRAKSGANRFSGLGVGLYISYRIVSEHGGRMWVVSEAAGGSTFGFALPIDHASKSRDSAPAL